MDHLIYLIHPQQFLSQGEPTYKIGKTTRSLNERLSEYPKGYKLILAVQVDNCHVTEKHLISLFDQLFTKRPEYGLEYYSGNVDKMCEVIYVELLSDNLRKKAILQKPLVKKYINNQKQQNELLSTIDCDDMDDMLLDQETDKEDPADSLDSKEAFNNILKLAAIAVKNVGKKTLKTFYKHIYDTRPDWFVENSYVSITVIERAYREYFNDEVTSKNVISKQLNGTLFSGKSRVNNINKKKLTSYEKLSTAFR